MNEKISFYSRPYPKNANYFDIIDTACEHGISSIEGFNMLDFELPDKEAARKIREYADSKNIVFSCFSVYINLVGEDSDKMTERVKGYVDVAQILGSPFIHHTIANNFQDPEGVCAHRDEYFEKGLNAVRQIYDYAAKKGIKAVYEEQGYIFNGMDGYRKFINAVDRNVGVVADMCNIYQADGDIFEFIKEFSDRIVHVHIKNISLTDDNPNGLGMKTLGGKYMWEAQIPTGLVDIKKAVELLKSIGYDGYYGIEYGASDDNSDCLRMALEFMDRIL